MISASIIDEIPAPQTGYITHIQSDEVGIASMILGGGRETKDSVIDLSVGIVLKKKVGDYVQAGEPLAVMYANDLGKFAAARNRLLGAYSYSDTPVVNGKLIKGIVTAKDIEA